MTRLGLVLVAAILAGAVIVLFIVEPIFMLRGWLAGFIWATLVPIGSLFFLVTHRITGGEWGRALSPVLEPAARAILPMAVLSLPILVFSERIYRWSEPAMPASIARLYMNAPLYALRTIVALIVWSVFAWRPVLRNTTLGAAITLIVLGIITNIIPVDWIVSTQPGFYSSAFGFAFCIEQMLACLALCAVLGTQGGHPKACRDLAGLLITLLLAWIYFFYVQFVIIWYGNLPNKVAWYIIRSGFPWPEIGGFAFAAGAVLPFLALLNKKVRESQTWLRIIGLGISLGIALHALWLIVPSFGWEILGRAILSFAFMGTLFAIWLLWNAPSLTCPHEKPSTAVPSHG